MKNLLITLCLMTWASSSGWSQTDYLQWECGYAKPKAGQAEMYKKGFAAHAKKYHAADPYKVYIWDVLTGPHSGEYFVALGPATFTQLDNRPSSAEHDADWRTNVSPYLESESESSYWRLDKDLNYRAEGSDNFGKSRIRYATLNPGEGDRWTEQMEKVYEVFKTKKYAASWTVYRRYGASTGPHVCTEMNFKNWAYLDSDINFAKDFDEVHGEGAFTRFLEEIAIAVDRTKTYDELISILSDISSQ